jgi:hypothetical protein
MAHRVIQALLAHDNMGDISAGCLHSFCALVNVGFSQLNLRPGISALGRQEPVMNDCCPVRKWVTSKPTLATDSNRCIADFYIGY